MRVFIKIYLFKSSYTICYITKDFLMLPDEQHYRSIGLNIGECFDINIEKSTFPAAKKMKYTVNALFLKPFLKECIIFEKFRANVVKNIHDADNYPSNGTVFLKLVVEPPDKEVIDYQWNYRMLYLIWLRIEIENAFSWFSTLGGAYSALGDYFDYCAEQAGKISTRQYHLSKMLGDESLAARSRLYSAIAYAQKGKLKLARYIVRNVAAFARDTHDKRLNRMCQGVWAKLKYLRTLKTQLPDVKEGGDNGITVTDSGDGKTITNKVEELK